jgi:hypothetical protein
MQTVSNQKPQTVNIFIQRCSGVARGRAIEQLPMTSNVIAQGYFSKDIFAQ